MLARTVADLADLIASGEKVKFLHFWGHKPQRDGSIGAGCLSQWWPAVFTVDGREYATAEHYMMWSKAMLFGDVEVADQILAASHPHRAKNLGRQDPAQWRGQNLLGFALMNARDRLRQGA